jgi:hypothetical protein
MKSLTKIAPRLLLGLISGMLVLAAGWPGNHVPINMYEETLKTVMSLVNIQLFPPSMHVFYRSVCIFQTVSEFHSFLYYIIIVSTTFSFRLVRKATTIGDKTGHCPPKDGEVQMLLTYTKKLQKEPQSMECGLLTLLISWEK